MTDLRKDYVINRWAIIATERSKRPSDLASREGREHFETSAVCPFEMGRETSTPPEVFAYRTEDTPPDTPGWLLRVVPNKFPALAEDQAFEIVDNRLLRSSYGYGVHEVIIEGPNHNLQLSEFDLDDLVLVLRSYRERMLFHYTKNDIRYVQVFKNHGKRGGASLEHSHSQLIALPFVPTLIDMELEGAKKHYESQGQCVFCDFISQEKELGLRIMAERGDMIALCPFASRYPFETWLLPQTHLARFETSPDTILIDTARLLKIVLGKLNENLNYPPYNFVLHSAPVHCDPSIYHWHIEVIPITTSIAGFERGTECYINTISPENAAAALKK
ncbi:MAG: hypothetical protein ACD_62C00255G0004 [uncultured bacterium]|nr:MAG: hypothetical protein ACD_62C00255G0004 [uncultured bacterium]